MRGDNAFEMHVRRSRKKIKIEPGCVDSSAANVGGLLILYVLLVESNVLDRCHYLRVSSAGHPDSPLGVCITIASGTKRCVVPIRHIIRIHVVVCSTAGPEKPRRDNPPGLGRGDGVPSFTKS